MGDRQVRTRMKRVPHPGSPLLARMALILATLACGRTAGARAGPSLFGVPARLDLQDPAASLAPFSSYRAEVVMTFSGANAARPLNWSETWTITSISDPRAYLLSLDLTSNGSASPGFWLEGLVDGVAYSRGGTDATCSAWLPDEEDSSAIATGPFNPLEYLPPVAGAVREGSPELLDGILAQRYVFDEVAVDAAGVAKATGELWVSVEAGYLLKYDLQAQGGAAYFGENVEGTITWAYTLSQRDQVREIPLPEDCPPGLVDLPTPADASDVSSQPGFMGYMTASSPQQVATFYQQALPSAAWQADEVPVVNEDSAHLAYIQADRRLTITVSTQGDQHSVWIIVEPKAPPAPGVATAETPTERSSVEAALDRLLGSGLAESAGPAYDSFRLNASGTDPQWDAAAQASVDVAYDLQAEVAGRDLHLRQSTRHGVAPAAKAEGYLVDGKEYELVNETIVPGQGNVAAAWALFPLYVNPALTFAALGATRLDEETLEGIPVTVYQLDSASVPEELLRPVQDLTGFVSARGKAWIDSQNGALLQLTLDYQVHIIDPASGVTVGTGDGHVGLHVTEVGSTGVRLP